MPATEAVGQRSTTAAGDAREGMSLRPQQLRLTPEYRRLRDALLRPHLRLTESRYFWERWKPRLGPDATILIMEVRDRCNRALAARRDGDVTDGCTVSAAELAAACGFSRVTLWRLLQRADVQRFIHVEHNYIYDRRLGKKRRTLSTYHVLMEDPLVEEDEAQLEQLLSARGAPDLPAATFQSETQVVENARATFQSETTTGDCSEKPQNVLGTIVKERLATSGSGDHNEQAPGANQRQPLSDAELWRRYPEIAYHVEEAERLLGDSHSRSFYVKTLRRLYPGYMDIWQRALGLAREQQRIRRSRGALFTRLLRTFAAEAGVML